MQTNYPVHFPQFFTATIYEWKHLLSNNQRKDTIIESLQFLVNDKRITLYAFVILNNHIHLIWQPLFGFSPSDVQASFMKYTAQQLKRSLAGSDTNTLAALKVNKYDRTYQVWKREPLSVELRTHAVFMQKLDYVHDNPVRAGLCIHPEDYYYSSAKFYYGGIDHFKMITHFSGN